MSDFDSLPNRLFGEFFRRSYLYPEFRKKLTNPVTIRHLPDLIDGVEPLQKIKLKQ